MISACAVRLGHNGVMAATSSSGSTSICIAIIKALTPEVVTATRSIDTGPCSALT